MSQRAVCIMGLFFFLMFILFGSTSVSHAVTNVKPQSASSPVELVNAVNGLRTSYGLPPYSINSILMSTAQAQADFLAITGSMTHAGPGGISFTDRLLAAGYPLAGDLSLGGFRAENITGGPEDMPAEAAVNRWTRDALHLNTMISPNLSEIGAGVAINNGRVYYVIDAALPTTSAAPQAAIDSVRGGTPAPVASPPGIIYPVSVSTPNSDGNVIHEVKPGQSLWLIAIGYETKIDEIKGLNNLFDNSIFPGQKLLIKTGTGVTVVPAIETPSQPATATLTHLPTSTISVPSQTFEPASIEVRKISTTNKTRIITSVIGIIALAVLGGVLFTWLGSVKNK